MAVGDRVRSIFSTQAVGSPPGSPPGAHLGYRDPVSPSANDELRVKSVLFNDSGTENYFTGLDGVKVAIQANASELGTQKLITIKNDAGTENISMAANGSIICQNLTVSGTKTINNTQSVLVSDNHFFMNSGYETTSGQTGGLVVNRLPTATNDTTIGTGVFTAGVDATSDPTVTTAGAATFAASDIVQLSGSANGGENDGLYEVLSHAANLLTIRSTADGITNQVEDFTDGQFVANAGDTGVTLRKITVNVLRARSTDGNWEVGSGAVTGISFTTLATTAGATLQTAYDAGPTITTSGASDIVFTLTSGDFQITGGGAGSFNVDSAADFSGGIVNSAGEILVSGGNLQLNDNIVLSIGTGDDLSISHDGTNTTLTSAAGDLIIDNTLATGSTINRLGTDTAATDFQVQNNSASALLTVDGSGQATFSGNVDATNGLDVTTAALTAAAALTVSGGALTHTGAAITLDPTAAFALSMDATFTATTTISDNLADAFLIQEGANAYLDITTTNASEAMNFGNATTNPNYDFLGSGDLTGPTGGINLGDSTAGNNSFVVGADSDGFFNSSGGSFALGSPDQSSAGVASAGGLFATGNGGANTGAGSGGATGSWSWSTNGFSGGGGGSVTTGTTGSGGATGGMTWTIGDGGDVDAGSGTGGDAGDFLWTGGTGGSSVDGNSGIGTSFSATGGTGGANTGTGISGDGGSYSIDAGPAGANSGGGSAGAAGTVSIGTTNAGQVTIGVNGNKATVINTQLQLVEETTPSGNPTNAGILYVKDDAGDSELFYFDDSGADVQITCDGFLCLGSVRETASTFTAGEILAAGEALFVSASGALSKADATAATGTIARAQVVGFATGAVSSAANFSPATVHGSIVTHAALAATANDLVYLAHSAGAAGDLTVTAPGSGDIASVVGIAISATQFVFMPRPPEQLL